MGGRIVKLDLEKKMALIRQPPLEEVVTTNELMQLLSTKTHPKHYFGIEISGLLHVGSLVLSGFKIRDLIESGFECTVFLADWHTFINEKFNGDWNLIRLAAKYYEEAFRLFCPGVKIVQGSELYRNNDEYWRNIIRFSKNITLARTVRCLTIMGRTTKESLDFSQYLYPSMQAVDIKALDLDLVHAGMDQRKVHMLAREVFPKLGWQPPVAIHHHLLPGLGRPEALGLDEDKGLDLRVSSKMSKSNPKNCIFIHDDAESIRNKIKGAWCPEGIIEGNPILEYARHLIFHDEHEFNIERPDKFGGDVTFTNYEEMQESYMKHEIHPADLKEAVARSITPILDPLRKHFIKRQDLLAPFQ